MKTNVNVLYHRDCADGFGAAWAAYQKLGYAGVSYHSCSYGEPPPEMEPGGEVYILDFSFPRNVMLEIMERYETVLIDHHETAEEEIGDLPGCHFDTSHSGAVLAWRWFHEESKMPEILLYVEDRDLWKWAASQLTGGVGGTGVIPQGLRSVGPTGRRGPGPGGRSHPAAQPAAGGENRPAFRLAGDWQLECACGEHAAACVRGL